MFGFLKKCSFTAMSLFSCNALKCVLINSQEYKIKPVIMNMKLCIILTVFLQMNVTVVVMI